MTGWSRMAGLGFYLKPPERVVDRFLAELPADRIVQDDAEIGEPTPLGAIHCDVDDHAAGPAGITNGMRTGSDPVAVIVSSRAAPPRCIPTSAPTGALVRLASVARTLGALADSPKRYRRLGQVHGGRWRLARQADDDQLVGAADHVPSVGFVFRRLMLESGRASALVAERHAVGLMKERKRTLARLPVDTVSAKGRRLSARRRCGAPRRWARARPPGGCRDRLSTGARHDHGTDESEGGACERVLAPSADDPHSGSRFAERVFCVANLHSGRARP